MGCCLVLALAMAFIVRPLRRGRDGVDFAPPAARGTSVEPLAIPQPLPAGAPLPNRRRTPGAERRGRRASTDPRRRARRASVRLGLATGLLGHAAAVSLLLATGLVHAEGVSPWVRALGLGAASVTLAARLGLPARALDLPTVLVVAGGTAFAAGLVDMHLLGAFSFGSVPLLAADLLLHGAPLVVVALGAALELRRPPHPLVAGAS